MTPFEFNRKQALEQEKLVQEMWLIERNRKLTQKERDLYNLRYMRTIITHGSICYRSGCIKTLDRAINQLKKECKAEKRMRFIAEARMQLKEVEKEIKQP